MLTLTSLNGQEKGREFRLTGDTPELLGRQAPNIVLADAQTSRKHAEVLLENNTWLIRDLDSTNGTWVNGQKIAQITELEVGDRIVIGRHQFRVSAISDLPAPSPKPLPIPTEPLIGDEALGEMGVDLGESLSADILDDEVLDLPEVPESAIDEESGDAPAAEEASSPIATPDDGVIDLDALLDDKSDDDLSHGTAAPQEPEPQDVESTTTSSADNDQGVIDIDELLADEPATAEEDAAGEAPVESEAQVEDEPDTAEVQDTTPPEAVAPDENVDFDLDELLGDELQDELAADELVDEIVHEEQDEDLAPDASAVDELETVSLPPVDLPDTDGSDSIEDIDALLEDLGADKGGSDESSIDEPDVLASAIAPPVDTPAEAGDRELPDAADADESAVEASTADDPDSLIDIDILAAAATAGIIPETDAGNASAPDTDATPASEDDATPAEDETVTPDVLDANDSGPILDDSGIFDSADTGAGLEEDLSVDLDDSIDALPDTEPSTDEEAAESPGPQLTTDSEEESDSAGDDSDVDEPLTSDLDDEAKLQETERKLLLSQEEQSEAVASYKRSKVMALSVVVLILAVVVSGVWYGVVFINNRVDANDRMPKTPPRQTTAPESDKSIPAGLDETPAGPPEQTKPVAIPDIKPPEPKVGIVRIPDIPAKEPPADTVNQDADQDAPVEPEPTPVTNDIPAADNTEAPIPALADSTPAPDPFEDVDTSVFDLPPVDDPGTAETPDEVAPDTTGTMTEQPGTDTPDPAPVEPEPTVSNDPAIDVPVEAATATEIETDPAPGTQITGAVSTDTTVDPETSAAPELSATDTPNQTQMNLLAGVMDDQNKPGTGVNEQAAFAGARRIVYLVDASGSLVDSFPRVLSELSFVIDNLEEGEAFTALFFGADGVTEVPPIGLKWADRQSKRDAKNWIDPENGNVNAWGRGDLMQALKLATDYGADEVVILSDNLLGRKPSQETIDTLLEDIAGITGDQVEKIHVIQFFTRDPKQVLKTIAERFNGSYSLIPAIAEPSAEAPGGDSLLFPLPR